MLTAAVILMGISMVACGDSDQTPLLERAESLMEEHPDSALGLLSAVDRQRLRGSEEKARYALLMTQAIVKNGFVIHSDSLLRPAIDHYSSEGDSPELMKTLFYQGEIEMNRFDSLINQPVLRSDSSPYVHLAKSTVFATQAYELSKHMKTTCGVRNQRKCLQMPILKVCRTKNALNIGKRPSYIMGSRAKYAIKGILCVIMDMSVF